MANIRQKTRVKDPVSSGQVSFTSKTRWIDELRPTSSLELLGTHRMKPSRLSGVDMDVTSHDASKAPCRKTDIGKEYDRTPIAKRRADCKLIKTTGEMSAVDHPSQSSRGPIT